MHLKEQKAGTFEGARPTNSRSSRSAEMSIATYGFLTGFFINILSLPTTIEIESPPTSHQIHQTVLCIKPLQCYFSLAHWVIVRAVGACGGHWQYLYSRFFAVILFRNSDSK